MFHQTRLCNHFYLPVQYSQGIIDTMEDGQQEHRKHERVPFRKEILIDGVGVSTSLDISEDGLYISGMQSYEENSFIEVTIPFKEEKLKIKAQVRYCQPGIGIGIIFIDLNDEQQTKIRELISSIKG
jgi:hypothetical protein